MTIQILRDFGADVEDGLGRCMNNEAFYLRMVGMMAEDRHAEALEEAIGKGDLQAAFEAAHALKGTLANLALTPALSVVTEILEPLRRREERADYPEGARRVLEEMEKLRALIRG